MNVASVVVIVVIIVVIVVFIFLKTMSQASGGKSPVTYTFKFGTKYYKITEPNLEAALGTYIYTSDDNMKSRTKITLDENYNDTKYYWTTSENITTMGKGVNGKKYIL